MFKYNQYTVRNCILLFFFSLFLNAVAAQTAIVKGKVTEKSTGEMISGATIYVDSVPRMSSEADGTYQLSITPGIHTIEVRMFSFATKKQQVNLEAGTEAIVNFSLESSSKELGTVVVSAGKFEQRIEDVTVSMAVVSPDLIQSKNTTTMEDAIDQIPGVNVTDGQANIRGGSGWSYGAGSRVQILVDDLPQLTADANDAKWTFLPVENLSQVEVIKGASSVLFGSSALNGVINIRTAYPTENPVTKFTIFTGVYDKPVLKLDGKEYDLKWWGSKTLLNAGSSFFHSQKFGQLDLTIGANTFADYGYRQGEREARGRFNVNTRYRFKKADGLSAGVNFNTMTTDGVLFFLWQNDTTGSYRPANNTLSDYRTYRTNVDPFITYADKKGNTFRLRTRWFGTKNENNTNQNSTAILTYYELQYQRRIRENFNITAGLVDQNSFVKSELYGDHDGMQQAFYVQGDLKWKKFSFSLGGRAEKNKIDDYSDELTPVFRAGVNYHLLQETYLRASAGQGYRFPSIAEKYVKTSVGNLIIYPNEDLSPEKGVSYEFGIRQNLKFGGLLCYVDAALFRNEYKNMMEFGFAQWGPITSEFFGNGFKSMNVGNTQIDGVEVNAGGNVDVAGDFSIRFMAGITLINPKQLTYDSLYTAKVGVYNLRGSDSSDVLKYRSRRMFKGDIDIRWKKFSVGMTIHYASRMENVDKIFVSGLLDFAFPPGLGIKHYRDHHPGGDAVYDLRTVYTISKNVRLSFIVKNLFNYIYMQRPADMQPPRVFVGQVVFEL